LGPTSYAPFLPCYSFASGPFAGRFRPYSAVDPRYLSISLRSTARQITWSIGAASTPSTSRSTQRRSRTL
jgi:hypothetical protein